jgi:amphi-Trp domain-containing protein
MAQPTAPGPRVTSTVDRVTAGSYLRSLADALDTGRLRLSDDDTFLCLRSGTRVRFRLRAKSDHGEETVNWETEGPPEGRSGSR